MCDQDHNSSSGPQADWLQRGFLLALLLACAVALSPNNVDPDLWGHVQYAEDLLADAALPVTATHTFTASGSRWINHENLSELAIALGYRAFGGRGLLVLKCLLGLGVMGLMYRTARRRGVQMPVAGGWLLLVATTLTAFWAVRPQLASYVSLALMVWLLDRSFATWHRDRRIDGKFLLVVPLLMVVWTNAHGGFAAGVCLLLVYLGGRAVEALYRDRTAALPTVAALVAVGVLTALATLANPYGSDLLLWLTESLRSPRPEILEWGAPAPADAFFLPMLLLYLATLAAWCLTTARRDWVQFVLISLCVWQSLLHCRHIALAAVLIGFWLPVHVQAVVERFRATRRDDVTSAFGRRLVATGLAVGFVLLGTKLASRLGSFPVPRDQYPVAALQYMAQHKLSGRLVVSFNWAQYALAALSPQTEVAFDGRFRTCYSQEVIDMHFDFLLGDVPGRRHRAAKSGPIEPSRVLHYFDPDLVLADRQFAHSERVLREADDFVLLYQDAVAQVWGRRAKYDDPSSDCFLALDRRSVSDRPQRGAAAWPALPHGRQFVPIATTGHDRDGFQTADRRPVDISTHPARDDRS